VLGAILSTTKVQTLLAHYFTSSLNQNFSNQISFSQFSLKLDGSASLKEVVLADHHADTLAYVKEVQLSLVDLNSLLEGDLHLKTLFIDQINIKNIHYPGEEDNALVIFFNEIQKSKASETRRPISIERLSVTEGSYQTIKSSNPKANTIALTQLDLEVEQLRVQGKQIKGKVLSLQGIEPKRAINLTKGQFEIDYEPQKLVLNSLVLQTENDYLAGTIEIADSSNIATQWNRTAIWRLELDSIATQLSSWIMQQSQIQKLPTITGRLEGKGRFNQFNIDTLRLESDWGHFALTGILSNILEPAQTNFDLRVAATNFHPQKWSASFGRQVEPYFTEEDQVDFQGQLQLQEPGLQYDLAVHSAKGKIALLGLIGKGILTTNGSKAFNLNATLDNVRVNGYINSNLPMTLTGNLTLEGAGKTVKELSASWQFEALKLKLPNKAPIAFDGSGTYAEQKLKNSLSIRSDFLKAKSDWVYDHTLAIPKMATAINVESLNLNVFSEVLGDGKALFKGIVLANVAGTHWDNLTGTLTGASLSLETAVDTLNFSPLTVSQKWENNERILQIVNQDILKLVMKGNYTSKAVVPLFQNALAEVYTFLPSEPIDSNQALRFNITIYEKIVNALYPKLRAQQSIEISGNLKGAKQHSQLTLDSPFFKWDGFDFENIHFQLDTQNPIYNTYLSVDALVYKSQKVAQFNLISTALKDTLYFRSEFHNKIGRAPFEINFYHTLTPDKTVVFGLQPSTLPLEEATWTLNPDNQKTQQIRYNPKEKGWQWTELLVQSPVAFIQSSGYWDTPAHFAVQLEANEVPWEAFVPQKESFQSSGKVGLSLNYVRSPEENQFQMEGHWKEVNINAQALGDLTLSARGNTQLHSYQLEMNLVDQEEKRLQGSGSILGWETPKLNLDLNLAEFKIDFLSRLGKTALRNIRGKVSGALNLWGPFDNLQHNGALNLEEGGLGIPYLNTDYSIAKAKVNLYEQTFDFPQVTLNDSQENTSAQLKGKINHNNFKNWSTNLTVTSPRIMLLNKPNAPEVLFYGNGYLNGNLYIDGPFRNLNITMVGSSEEGTSIKIPWAEDYGLVDTSYIQMIDKSKEIEQQTAEDQKRVEEQISGLELNFELDVTPKAEIEIVIDQETGSFLRGRGAGSLFMEINTAGKFNMWGDFITYDGIYNFKNLGVIDKKFDVKPGGTIVWDGDPLDAQMNIEALYEVPGGANPALMLDNPNFNKKIDTEVLIQLQGNLLKPDDPLFEIEFPNTSGTVASEINYRLADPQRRQLQALSLLSQGIFINEVSVSMQGITNNLYQKASDIFSSLLNEDNNKLQIGVDYLQGDKSALLDIATADRLGFTLSTKLSEKILLNGKIGVPVGGVEQTLVVGNVQIDFLLNEDGTLKAKVFNRENEFRYISDELGYTQGVGLSYQVDFNTFSALIQKIAKGSQGNLNSNSSTVLDAQEGAMLEFVDKK